MWFDLKNNAGHPDLSFKVITTYWWWHTPPLLVTASCVHVMCEFCEKFVQSNAWSGCGGNLSPFTWMSYRFVYAWRMKYIWIAHWFFDNMRNPSDIPDAFSPTEATLQWLCSLTTITLSLYCFGLPFERQVKLSLLIVPLSSRSHFFAKRNLARVWSPKERFACLLSPSYWSLYGIPSL